MWFDGYCCRLRTASQSCTNWIRCSSGRPWGIMWTGILSIMWWISCMLYWDSAWSQSLTVSIAGIRNSHLNIPKLFQQKEAIPFSFPLKKKKIVNYCPQNIQSISSASTGQGSWTSSDLTTQWSHLVILYHPVHLKLKTSLLIHPICFSWLFKESIFIQLCLRQEVFCFMTWPSASWNGLFNPGFILNGDTIEH